MMEFTKLMETNLQKNYKHGPQEVFLPLAQSSTQPAQPMGKKVGFILPRNEEIQSKYSSIHSTPPTMHPLSWAKLHQYITSQ